MDFAKLLTKFDSINSPAESLEEAWPGTSEWKKKQPGFNPYDPESKEKEKLKLKPYGYRGPAGSDSNDEPKSSKKDKKTKKVKESNEVNEDDVEEGNEFTGAMTKAKAQGKTEFEVGGKTYKVKESLEFDDELDEVDNKDAKKDQETDTGDDNKSDAASGDSKDVEKADDAEKSGRTDEDLVMYRYLLGSGANFALIKAFLDHVDRGEAIPGPMVKEYSPVIKMVDNIVKSGPSAINYIRMAQNFVGNSKPESVSESKIFEECYDQAMSDMSADQQSGLNVNSSLDTKTGNQSLTVTARGQAADQLAQLLKLSGILNVTQMADSTSMDVDMGEDYANEPDPMIQSITPQLKQGNDMHRIKKTYPKVNGGDNPMQKIAENNQHADAIEQRLNTLMEELSTIKVFKNQK